MTYTISEKGFHLFEGESQFEQSFCNEGNKIFSLQGAKLELKKIAERLGTSVQERTDIPEILLQGDEFHGLYYVKFQPEKDFYALYVITPTH